ncbi:MAG: hypothetical protein Q4P72_06455, partial [Eubacteriales bacterium]|nr:hypothetical protein [Eubacteriales bacterium]
QSSNESRQDRSEFGMPLVDRAHQSTEHRDELFFEDGKAGFALRPYERAGGQKRKTVLRLKRRSKSVVPEADSSSEEDESGN